MSIYDYNPNATVLPHKADKSYLKLNLYNLIMVFFFIIFLFIA